MGPDGGDHSGRVAQRPEVAGWAISGRDFDLSDDSACARGTDDERRLRLIPLSRVPNQLQQAAPDPAKAALRVPDGTAGTPGDGTR